MSTAVMRMAMLVAMLVPMPVTAQLLNGSFENPPQTTGYTTVSAGNYIDPGVGYKTWKVTAGSIDIGTGPAATTCHSNHCIDLNGNNPGRIEQPLTGLVAGQLCTVRFFLSRHRNLTTSATLLAFINTAPTSPATFVHNATGVSPTDGKWQAMSFTFTATGSDVLAFGTAMPSNAGPQIDDVAISCTPPPAPTKVDPCCPPWNATTLGDHMVYQGVGGIGGRYTLKFTPTALLNTQLTAYMAYVHAMVPAISTISIDFKLFDAGILATPVLGAALTGTFTETWGTSGGPTPVPAFFNPAPPAMQTNHWYTIQTVIRLNGGTFFPDSCAKVEISVRIQVQGMAPNNAAGSVLQLRMPDGKIIEREVKP